MPKSKAPAQTFEEPKYLTQHVESESPVRVNLRNGDSFDGAIEYWDADFLRLTCNDGRKIFIYKHDIRYIAEL
jgi:sRNA-binding regulator protein Hfq